MGESNIYGMKVMTYKNLIWIPVSHQIQIITWYHDKLLHTSTTRLINTRSMFGWSGLCKDVEHHDQTCPECQQYKIMGKKIHGKIPLMSAQWLKNSFKVIHVDCCVLLTVNYKHSINKENIKDQILLLTMVDAATGWPEFGPLINHS